MCNNLHQRKQGINQEPMAAPPIEPSIQPIKPTISSSCLIKRCLMQQKQQEPDNAKGKHYNNNWKHAYKIKKTKQDKVGSEEIAKDTSHKLLFICRQDENSRKALKSPAEKSLKRTTAMSTNKTIFVK